MSTYKAHDPSWSPEPKPVLYAVACERVVIRDRQQLVIPEIVHLHAVSEGNARWVFGQDPDNRKSRIVAVGPVIGYHVEDEHGDILTA